MRDLKSIYVDLNRIDEFAALANAMPGHIRFDANEQDSLTYAAAEKIYIKGRMEEAKTSLNKYLQTFPEGEEFKKQIRPILDQVYVHAEHIIGIENVETMLSELKAVHNVLENI